jgi:hypothetical protein
MPGLTMLVCLYINLENCPLGMTDNLKYYLKDTLLLKSVTKQHVKIKIITYLCLITKAAKRQHLNIYFVEFYRSTCT